MYVIYIIDYIHHLLNKNLKSKKLFTFETGGSILFLYTKLKQKRKKEYKRNRKKRGTLSNKKFQMHHFEENSKDPLEETRDKETQRLTRHKLGQKIRT